MSGPVPPLPPASGATRILRGTLALDWTLVTLRALSRFAPTRCASQLTAPRPPSTPAAICRRQATMPSAGCQAASCSSAAAGSHSRGCGSCPAPHEPMGLYPVPSCGGTGYRVQRHEPMGPWAHAPVGACPHVPMSPWAHIPCALGAPYPWQRAMAPTPPSTPPFTYCPPSQGALAGSLLTQSLARAQRASKIPRDPPRDPPKIPRDSPLAPRERSGPDLLRSPEIP